ncbi:hypothetical protein ACFQY7_08160 [Actinomadura luteofluorescens]|uniref:hypothetical protein n=1 Tax=Actinomadura luteofluorescens TaxID=46163 RepID=UPI00362E16B2
MDRPSRRNVLMTGGALGALGALGVASPAQASSRWTWSPEGSVAGAGRGADPRWVWDPEVDALVASLLDRGDVPRVNELLRTWTKNGQPLPDGLPADLRDFMERARGCRRGPTGASWPPRSSSTRSGASTSASPTASPAG